MRVLNTVVEAMNAVIGDSDPELCAALRRVCSNAAYAPPECRGDFWAQLGLLHYEARPFPDKPNAAQPKWWRHAGEILADVRSS